MIVLIMVFGLVGVLAIGGLGGSPQLLLGVVALVAVAVVSQAAVETITAIRHSKMVGEGQGVSRDADLTGPASPYAAEEGVTRGGGDRDPS